MQSERCCLMWFLANFDHNPMRCRAERVDENSIKPLLTYAPSQGVTTKSERAGSKPFAEVWMLSSSLAVSGVISCTDWGEGFAQKEQSV